MNGAAVLILGILCFAIGFIVCAAFMPSNGRPDCFVECCETYNDQLKKCRDCIFKGIGALIWQLEEWGGEDEN